MNKTVLIACEVFRPELERLTQGLAQAPEIVFLEQGLHDTPDTLRSRVQEAVERAEHEGATTILLGYGLCGRGLSGVSGRTATLVLPLVHDCIPLLLGVDQDEARKLSRGGSTYWMSPGWLRYSQVPFIRERKARLADYEARFDADAAAYLMELEGEWLKNYTTARLILWEGWENEEELVRMARAVAEDTDLPYGERAGTGGFLQALLEGRTDERFIRLRPGETVDIDGDGVLRRVGVVA